MKIESVGVIGAGTMGNGIAQVCAASGLKVTMVDIAPVALENAFQTIEYSLDRLVRKEKLSSDERRAALDNIRTSTELSELSACDLVIEAASEAEHVKLSLINRLDEIVRQDTVIASNTSSISITKLAAATSNPNRFIGMHFLTPCR